jgi:hypothetical protein
MDIIIVDEKNQKINSFVKCLIHFCYTFRRETFFQLKIVSALLSLCCSQFSKKKKNHEDDDNKWVAQQNILITISSVRNSLCNQKNFYKMSFLITNFSLLTSILSIVFIILHAYSNLYLLFVFNFKALRV